MTQKMHQKGVGRWAWAAIAAAVLVAACGGGGGGSSTATPSTPTTPTTPTTPVAGAVKIFDRTTAPAKLSEWNLVLNDGNNLTLNQGVIPYDLNSALFTDYAFKLRAIYVPAGKKITYKVDGTLDFPIGSAIAKTFYYPKATGTDPAYQAVARQNQTEQGSSIALASHVLIETRLLVLQDDGTWVGLPYVWDADQKDATLRIGGRDVPLELVGSSGNEKITYAVPSASDCLKCHSTQNSGGNGILPIGPKARNMNKNYEFSAGNVKNQLTNLDDLKLLAGFTGLSGAPANVDWRDATKTYEARAKAYLDVNCAHCHSSRGAAFQSGLMLDYDSVGNPVPSNVTWGVCKKPLAYGGAGATRKYDIEPGNADLSVLLYRMSHTATADVMPSVGRKVNHTEGIEMVRGWINQLTLPGCGN